MFLWLLLLSLCGSCGLQVWRTLFNNFAVEIAHLDGSAIGIIQSVREIPGFLALLVIYLLLFLREERLAVLSIVIMGAGVAATGFFPSETGLIVTTLAMSFGFHYFETVNQSLTLQHFNREETPMVLATIRSRVSACNVGIGLFFLLLGSHLPFTMAFGGFGVLLIAVAMASGLRTPDCRSQVIPQRKEMVVRRRYGLFYLLTFLAGARRQIFVAFVLFLMVQRFHFSVAEIAGLFLLNNAAGWLFNPWIGRAVNFLGERKILSIEYFLLIFVFCGYAFTDSKVVVVFLYILDNMVFYFSIAIKTFFQKIADPADIAPSMGVSFTINHIAAVIIPATGGLLWMVDYRAVFLGGAALALLSLLAVQGIDRRLRTAKQHRRDI